MTDWLVITAEHAGAGRGVRGYALTWFLRTYFGRRAVTMLSAARARQGNLPKAETLFLGLPTQLSRDEIHRVLDEVGSRRIVPFDYLDQQKLAWTPEQEAVLRERTDRYFKPWHEKAWNYRLRMGMLPLRTHPQLFLSIARDRLSRKLGFRPKLNYDVAFFGRPNPTAVIKSDGSLAKIDQRVDWLLEIHRELPELRIGGGITGWRSRQFQERIAQQPALREICYARDGVNFFTYWQALRSARVLLSPGGNAPWTYRHYECLYAASPVVTIDFRQRDMLVPLPRENMVHVPDGASVLPAVREAFELRESRPNLFKENFEHLERYLHWGSYSRSRVLLRDRFLAQLE